MKTSIPIYVINLRRNPERKLFIQRQLDAFNLDYQFIDAVDKYDLEFPEHRSQIAKDLGIDKANLEYKYSKLVDTKISQERKSEGLGRIACLLSHVKTHNLIIENNDKVACVLEDDAVLLPTFPEILTMAPKFSWDILMLSSHSRTILKALENLNGMYKRLVKITSYNYIVLVRRRSNQSGSIQKHITELLGLSAHSYSNINRRCEEILEEFNREYRNMIELYNQKKSFLWLLSPTQSESIKLYKELIGYIGNQIGGLPSKQKQQAIGAHHYITVPAEKPTLTTAYLINQVGAREWRTKAIAQNTLQVDGIPWPLYTENKVNLRLVSLPCVITSRAYARYPVRQI